MNQPKLVPSCDNTTTRTTGSVTSCKVGHSTTTSLKGHGLPRRMDLSFLFLIWLCMTLVLSPFEGDAQRVDAPNGVNRVDQFDTYFRDTTKCTVKGGECCENMTSIGCQGWFCIQAVCSVLSCENCPKDNGDDRWFCGHVDGVTRHGGMACKRKAIQNQTCHNETMPCVEGMVCSGVNSTCQYTPELWKEYQEEVRSRRITMAGMIVILIGMFLAMRRMLKNEEARRRQIWEPVDSSAEASILQRLAEDTQRRVAGGWGQISGTLVEGGNAASAAVGTAFSRIRNNVRNATAGVGNRSPDDCDDSMEMLPNGRRAQTRRELEADMRDFLLEGDDEEDDDEHAWDQVRDEDGLLAHHNSLSRSSGSGGNRPGASSAVASSSASMSSTGINGNPEGFPDEPPTYDEVRTNGQAPISLHAGLQSPPGSSTARSDTTV